MDRVFCRIIYLLSGLCAVFVLHGFLTSLVNWNTGVNILLFSLFLLLLSGLFFVFRRYLSVDFISINKPLLLFTTILCLLCVAFLDLTPRTSPFSDRTKIEIITYGDKNPIAKSNEIWFKGIYHNNKIDVKPTDFANNGQWVENSEAMLANTIGESVLKWEGRLQGASSLKFTSHPWSGVVEVKVDGSLYKKVDLYSSQDNGDDFIDLSIQNNKGIKFYFLIYRIALVFSIGLFLCLILQKISINRRVNLQSFLLGSLVCYLLISNNNSYYGDVRFIGFFQDLQDNKLHYSTGYGFNSYQSVDLNVQNPLVKSFESELDKDATLLFKVKNDGNIKIFDTTLSSRLVPTGSAQLEASVRTDSITLYRVDKTENLESIEVKNNPNKEIIDVTGRTGETYILVDTRKEQMKIAFSNFEILFDRWILDGGKLEALRVNSHDEKGEIIQIKPSNQYQNLVEGIDLFGKGNKSTDGITFEGKVLKSPNPASRDFLQVLAALLGGILFVLLRTLFCFRKQFISFIKSHARVSVLLIGTYFLLHLLLWWPGVIMGDSMSPIIQYVSSSFSTWYGIGIPIYTGVFKQFGPLGFDILIQSSIFLAFFIFIFVFASRNKVPNYLTIITMLFIFTFSFVGYASVYRYRDSISAIVNCIILFILWYKILNKKTIRCSTSSILEIGLFTLFFISYIFRIDNLVIISFAILLLYLTNAMTKKRIILLSAILISFVVSSMYITSKLPSSKVEKPWYTTTALINPIGSIVSKEDYKSSDKQKDMEIINKTMDANVLQTKWTPLHIGYWHDTQKLDTTDDQAVKDLTKLYFRLMIDNPKYYIQGRIQTFIGAMGTKAMKGYDFDLADENSKQLMDFGVKRSFKPRLIEIANDYFLLLSRYVGTWPQLIMTVLVIFFFRKNPITSIVALCLLTKVSALVVLAPTSFLSYYFDLHIFGIFIPILAYIERGYKKRKVCSKSNNGNILSLRERL